VGNMSEKEKDSTIVLGDFGQTEGGGPTASTCVNKSTGQYKTEDKVSVELLKGLQSLWNFG